MKKATTPNSKCFWNTINELQGKCKKTSMKLADKDGKYVTDDESVSNLVAEHFENKVNKLTKSMPVIAMRDYKNLRPTENFTVDEIIQSLKKSKNKMSSGPDSIPMKIVKAYGLAFPDVYTKIFNDVIHNGFPETWKLARVVPVPKKGNLHEVSNYRPVSNLCSLSKILERCVLNRLNSCQVDLIGPHQHGFRDQHSTTTCALELKDNIVEQLEKKRSVLVYSLDLSAAFDLLRPDTFFDKFVGKISDGLLRFIMDFLSDRRFYVNIGKASSGIRTLDRGCPQGSV